MPEALARALMPRATTALAVTQADMVGASTALTTVHCCLIGVLGGNFAPLILDMAGIENPISRGLGIGGSGLALAAGTP